MTIKTPEQIADDIFAALDLGDDSDGNTTEGQPKTDEQIDDALCSGWLGGASVRRWIEDAIVADRAQREQYSVVAEMNRDGNEASVGAYASRFEAEAVAEAWNRVNGQYGIEYRVEVDW